MIAFFFGGSCPDGWTELTEARGRAIIGLPAGGTNGNTHGSQLTGNSPATRSLSHSHTASASVFTPTTVTPGASGVAVSSASPVSHTHTISVFSSSLSISTGDIIPTIQVSLIARLFSSIFCTY